jgi:integration host factor subunit beta
MIQGACYPLWMNRSDLVNQLAEHGQLSGRRAEQVVNLILDAMAKALAEGERIEVRNFGSFVSKSYRARHGRNPRTGSHIDVPAKRLPTFKVGKELRERIDKQDA